MDGNYFLVKQVDYDTIQNAHKYIDQHLERIVNQGGNPAYIKVDEYKPKRSLSANALYWMWNKQIADDLTKRGRPTTDREIHTLMKHKFLGYKDWGSIGKTQIGNQLRSTTELNKSEFCYYLQQIEAWAAECGVLVKTPVASEYKEYLDSQNR
jgi:hypothetical protein